MKQQFLEVGKITNVHGLMGEVRVQPWADSPDFLCQFKTLYVDKTHWPIQVERARVHKNMVILKLEGVTDVNSAMAMRNEILDNYASYRESIENWDMVGSEAKGK
mgnify:CR=1 FL=1